MSLNQIFQEVAHKHETTPEVVEKIYNSMWAFMRKTIKELPDLKKLSTEELNDLKTNFYIPNFGRLYVDVNKVKKKRQLKKLK